MKAIWLILVSTGVMAQETVRLEPSPLELPRRIGPLVLSAEPNRYENPAMGISYQYSASGNSLTVYVYDAGLKDLADGPDTVATCEEFSVAKQGIEANYQNPKLVSENTVKLLPPAPLPAAREAFYEFERNGQATLSYVWITGVARHFIKLRYSVNPELRDEIPEARRVILAAVGEAIRPHLAPVDPQAEPPGTSINLSADMLEKNGDAAMAFMYPAFVSTLLENSPELAPPCGGEVVLPHAMEVDLLRQLFLTDLGGSGAFSKAVKKADEAGFLEELVWLDMHRRPWGDSPPAGLQLDEYRVWKKKNLKRFKAPALGRVVVQAAKPLPPEPPAP